MAEKSLVIFKEIEQSGGFLKQLKEGIIQRKISENAQKEQILFDNNQLMILGSNRYPNPSDQMKNTIEIFPFVRKKVRKTLITPIIPKRLTEQYEQNRLHHEA
jgi:methylmalonyl-CoA mutase